MSVHKQSSSSSGGCLNTTSLILGSVASIVTILAFCGISGLATFTKPQVTAQPQTPSSNEQPLDTSTQPLTTVTPTITFSTPSSPALQNVSDQGLITNLDTEYKTNIEGLSMILNSIEILPSDKMRWNFTIINQTSKDQELSWSFTDSYIADQLLNRYSILDDSTERKSQNWNETYIFVQKKTKMKYWIDFEIPIEQAKSITFYPITTNKLSPFSVDLSTVKGLPTVSPQATTEPNANIITINQNHDTGVDNFNMILNTIDFNPNGRMRWSFTIENKTNKDHQLTWSFYDSYVSDNELNKYTIIDDSTGRKAQNWIATAINVQPKTKVKYWIDFDSPQSRPENLTFYFVGGTSLSPLTVSLPK